MPITMRRRKIKGKASGSKGHFTSSAWHPTRNELGNCSSNIKEDQTGPKLHSQRRKEIQGLECVRHKK